MQGVGIFYNYIIKENIYNVAIQSFVLKTKKEILDLKLNCNV